MGIDYYVCSECGEAFPDVADFGYCGTCADILCEYCKDALIKKHGEVTDPKFIMDYGESNPCTCTSCEEAKGTGSILEKIYDTDNIVDIERDISEAWVNLPTSFEGTVTVTIKYKEG